MPTPVDPEEELALFVYRLSRDGVYVLACGGGVISEPKEAIERLAGCYGHDDLQRLCSEIVRRRAQPYGFDLPEGVWGTIAGILEHLDDAPDVDHWLYHFRPNACLGTWVGGRRV
jgi:hypothetical protein